MDFFFVLLPAIASQHNHAMQKTRILIGFLACSLLAACGEKISLPGEKKSDEAAVIASAMSDFDAHWREYAGHKSVAQESLQKDLDDRMKVDETFAIARFKRESSGLFRARILSEAKAVAESSIAKWKEKQDVFAFQIYPESKAILVAQDFWERYGNGDHQDQKRIREFVVNAVARAASTLTYVHVAREEARARFAKHISAYSEYKARILKEHEQAAEEKLFVKWLELCGVPRCSANNFR